MNDTPETLTIYVHEKVEYRHTLTVTPELLAEAEAEGYAPSVRGVLEMLESDEDHEIVSNDATTPHNFLAVISRQVWEHDALPDEA